MADGLPQVHGFCVLQGKRESDLDFSEPLLLTVFPHQAEQELRRGPGESEHPIAYIEQREKSG